MEDIGLVEENTFRLKRLGSSGPNVDLCIAVTQDKLRLKPCDQNSLEQVFKWAGDLNGYFQVRNPVSGKCLDASGGEAILVYGCYPISENANQAWQRWKDRLVWETSTTTGLQGHCATFQNDDVSFHDLEVKKPIQLAPCADKRGQRFRRHDAKVDGTFLLRDADSLKCLAASEAAPGTLERLMRLSPCHASHRFRWLKDRGQVQHVATEFCMDAGNEVPILYPCHVPKAMRKQRFEVDSAGWVQLARGWEDNGRKKFFERCLDYLPVAPLKATLQSCEDAKRKSLRWKRINTFEPPEHVMWRNAKKRPSDALPLGGDMAPPP
eukprot:TRINITY_DN19830_c0_g1_i2.p1 TRINITY_DN19830_c0_g1~~TRINITY_DN19830_c0_g1_i2.p1  ORF type:complete len:323 (-),score=55.92 TRINITY_DN19830_c0_g1_i2:180-1148(-)